MLNRFKRKGFIMTELKQKLENMKVRWAAQLDRRKPLRVLKDFEITIATKTLQFKAGELFQWIENGIRPHVVHRLFHRKLVRHVIEDRAHFYRPKYPQAKAADETPFLYGSNVQPSTFTLVDGTVVPLGDIVRQAYQDSGVSGPEEWNAEGFDEMREAFIQEVVSKLELAEVQPDAIKEGEEGSTDAGNPSTEDPAGSQDPAPEPEKEAAEGAEGAEGDAGADDAAQGDTAQPEAKADASPAPEQDRTQNFTKKKKR